MKGRGFALTVVLSLLGATRTASAFCPATTCDPSDATQQCRIDARTQCVTSGKSLFWNSSCVTFSLQKDAAPRAGIDYAAAKASVEHAFDAWTSADCGGHGPSLRFTLSEPVACDASEYSKDHHNANIIVFREDEWPYEGAEDALGLTRVRFDPDVNVGELYDTDIEVNAVAEPLSAGEPKANEVDLESLLTHEIGHALGLGHSLDLGSTMLAGYHEGSIDPRTLGDDDVAGVCSVYPPDRRPASTSCEPRHGFSSLCAADQPASETPPTGAASEDDDTVRESSSCRVAGARGVHGPQGWLSSALVGLATLGRLRRRSKGRTRQARGRRLLPWAKPAAH